MDLGRYPTVFFDELVFTNLWGPFIDRPPVANRSPRIPADSPSVATDPHRWTTAKIVTATEVATNGPVVDDRWPSMDFLGLSTREVSK